MRYLMETKADRQYTRRRRWQRRAVLTETVIHLPSEAHDDDKTAQPSPTSASFENKHSPLKSRPVVAPQVVSAETRSGHKHDSTTKEDDSDRGRSSSVSSEPVAVLAGSPAKSRDDALRQRLKKAMGNAGA